VVDQAIGEWHKLLKDEGVQLGVLMAINGDGPAVKHGGYPAMATIRVVPLKDRVTKEYDAELLIDEKEWNQLKPEHRLALCDHELTHLELATEKESGEVKRDDLGRPKLKTRKGDWNGGDGFAEVVERHGDFAVEFLNAQRAFTRAKAASKRKPSLLDGIDPPAADQGEGVTMTVAAGGQTATMSARDMRQLNAKLEDAAARAASREARTGKRRK
jgi:hypothetical protein